MRGTRLCAASPGAIRSYAWPLGVRLLRTVDRGGVRVERTSLSRGRHRATEISPASSFRYRPVAPPCAPTVWHDDPQFTWSHPSAAAAFCVESSGMEDRRLRGGFCVKRPWAASVLSVTPCAPARPSPRRSTPEHRVGPTAVALRTGRGRGDLVGRAVHVRLAVVEARRRKSVRRPPVIEEHPALRLLPDEPRLDDLRDADASTDDASADESEGVSANCFHIFVPTGNTQLSMSDVSMADPGGR